MTKYTKIKEYAEIIRAEMSEEEQAAALQAAGFYLFVSAPRKSSHSGSEGQAYFGLLFATLGGIDVPPDVWAGYGWHFASRATAWAEKNLPVQNYPRTRAEWLDLEERYGLYSYLDRLREMIRERS